MPDQQRPYFIFDIARSLARKPGRLEADLDEARRIGADIYRAYKRGEFAEADVVVMAGEPPEFLPITLLRTKAGRDWQDPGETLVDLVETPDGRIRESTLWYRAFALTPRATKQYLARCGLAGASRLLKEWFGADKHRYPDLEALLDAYKRRAQEYARREGIPPLTTTQSGEKGDREWAAENGLSRNVIEQWRRDLFPSLPRGRPRIRQPK